MDYVTIPDVELLTVGMKWPASNGDCTFTFEHLRDAMVAANDDPHVVPPRLKIGHVDPRFADPDDPGHNPYYDGEPAVGSVHNLRLANDGAVLIGDYVEVPLWLAEASPSAFPSRSIEGAWLPPDQALGEPDGRWDVVTPGGKRYSFVLTACALLGLARPAVQDLEDLRRFLTEGDGLVVAGTEPEGGQPASASISSVTPPRTTPVDATSSVDKVIDAFVYDWLPDDPADPMYWAWPRDVLTDPNQIVADDDEGGLFLLPFTSNDQQEVSFGDPQRVLQTFVPAPEAAVAAAASRLRPEGARVLASFKSRAESPAPERKSREVGGGSSATGRTSRMDRKALAADLAALPEDATPEQTDEVLARHGVSAATEDPPAGDPPAGDPPAGDPPADPPEGDPAEDDNGAEGGPSQPTTPADPPAASLPEGMVAVPRETWESVQSNAQSGADLAVKAEEKRRDDTIEAAFGDGKIAPSSRESMVNLHADPRTRENFYTLLTADPKEGGLARGIVPTGGSRGIGGGAPVSGAEVSTEDMGRMFGPSYAGSAD